MIFLQVEGLGRNAVPVKCNTMRGACVILGLTHFHEGPCCGHLRLAVWDGAHSVPVTHVNSFFPYTVTYYFDWQNWLSDPIPPKYIMTCELTLSPPNEKDSSQPSAQGRTFLWTSRTQGCVENMDVCEFSPPSSERAPWVLALLFLQTNGHYPVSAVWVSLGSPPAPSAAARKRGAFPSSRVFNLGTLHIPQSQAVPTVFPPTPGASCFLDQWHEIFRGPHVFLGAQFKPLPSSRNSERRRKRELLEHPPPAP